MKRKYTNILHYGVGVSRSVSCQLGKHVPSGRIRRQQLDCNGTHTLSPTGTVGTLNTDTTLQALIERTLEYNKDMKIAAARVKELAAMKRIDFANLFPQVSGKLYADKEAENYGGDNYDSGAMKSKGNRFMGSGSLGGNYFG